MENLLLRFWCKKSIKFGHTDIINLRKDVISMKKQNLFKWKHYQPDVIILTVRWYLRYSLSFRDLVEMMKERGISISHTTIMRWVHQYSPELDNEFDAILNKRMTPGESMKHISK